MESLALPHGEGCFEVACNILDPAVSPPSAVERAVHAAAQQAVPAVRAGKGSQLNVTAAEALAFVAAAEGKAR